MSASVISAALAPASVEQRLREGVGDFARSGEAARDVAATGDSATRSLPTTVAVRAGRRGQQHTRRQGRREEPDGGGTSRDSAGTGAGRTSGHLRDASRDRLMTPADHRPSRHTSAQACSGEPTAIVGGDSNAPPGMPDRAPATTLSYMTPSGRTRHCPHTTLPADDTARTRTDHIRHRPHTSFRPRTTPSAHGPRTPRSGHAARILTRAVEGLFDREGRSLHLRAAGGALIVLVVVMLTGSWAVIAAEQGAKSANLTTYPSTVWWSVETATTVGYGDFYPVTLWGRIVGGVMMVVGITTYGIVTAALATWFVGRGGQAARPDRPRGRYGPPRSARALRPY
ncbi:hypothetical protein SALBM311S_01426 [Streptomyces alboniger]